MFFIGLTVAVIALCGLGALAALSGAFDRGGTRNRALPFLGFGGTGAVILVIAFVVSAYEEVEAGHVGVVRTFGEITGTLSPGANWIMPWQTVQHQNVQTQRALFRNRTDPQEQAPAGSTIFSLVNAGSIETQQVDIFASVNYHLDPNLVAHLFEQVGANWVQTLFPDKVQEHIKSVVVRYPAIEVTQKRDEIGRQAERQLQEELGPYGIVIEAIQLVNISYSPEFEAEVERKQTATQTALRQAEQVKVEEQIALQNKAKAKGEADREIEVATGNARSIELRAEAQANANRKISESLTPSLLQAQAIEKLGGVTVALVPADGTTLIDPTGILRRP